MTWTEVDDAKFGQRLDADLLDLLPSGTMVSDAEGDPSFKQADGTWIRWERHMNRLCLNIESYYIACEYDVRVWCLSGDTRLKMIRRMFKPEELNENSD